MRRKALINLISCVLSIAIIVGSGIFAFSKLYQKEQEVVSAQKEEVLEETAEEEDVTKLDEKKVTKREEVTEKTEKTSTTTSAANKNKVTTTAPLRSGEPSTTSAISSEAAASEKAAKNEASILGLLWDPIEQVFYSVTDPWGRNFGSKALHDLAGTVVLYYDTVSMKFTCGGYDWLVQFWKGQYGFVLLGAEVGIYYKPEGSSIENYIMNDNSMRLKVGYTCYDKGEVIFTRDYQDTWWLSGFVAGKLDFFNDRSEMAMDIRITLRGPEMRDAFCESLEKCGFKRDNTRSNVPDTYYFEGNDVHIFWQNISQ